MATSSFQRALEKRLERHPRFRQWNQEFDAEGDNEYPARPYYIIFTLTEGTNKVYHFWRVGVGKILKAYSNGGEPKRLTPEEIEAVLAECPLK